MLAVGSLSSYSVVSSCSSLIIQLYTCPFMYLQISMKIVPSLICRTTIAYWCVALQFAQLPLCQAE
jgi:hypothetical protein